MEPKKSGDWEDTPIARASMKARLGKTATVYKPNIKRQIILAVLALIGVSIGYGMGFVFKKPVTSPPQAIEQLKPEKIHESVAPSPVKPDTVSDNTIKSRPYEEPLPDNIVTITPLKVTTDTGFEKPIEGQPTTILKPKTKKTPEIPATQMPGIDVTEVKPTYEGDTRLKPVHGPDELLANLTPNTDEQTDPVKSPTGSPTPPAWLLNAVPVIDQDQRPRIAIVIDDMGVDRARSTRTVQLPAPLTLSYLAYAHALKAQADNAKSKGHELMLHVPMEPESATVDPGPNVLLVGMTDAEIRVNLENALSLYDGIIGINNHMGSRFTSDIDGMMIVMQTLKDKGLIFLDSMTSGGSKGREAAVKVGIPFAARNIFLDHEEDLSKIQSRLSDVEKLAKSHGYAIAIGHPRETTLQALVPWLESLESKGFRLVPLSNLLHSPG